MAGIFLEFGVFRLSLTGLGAACVFGAAAVVAQAQVTVPFYEDVDVKARVEYYDVGGETPRQVIDDIYAKNPDDGKGHGIARTDTKMDVSIKWQSDNVTCTVVDVAITLDITFTYPQPPAVILMTKEWDRFITRLTEHEEKHGKIAREMAAHFAKEVRNLRGPHSPRCQGMKDVQNRLQAEVTDWFGRRQDELDATDGGTTYVSEYLTAADRATRAAAN